MKKQTNRRDFLTKSAGIAGTLALFNTSCSSKASSNTADFWDVIQHRRSVRAYRSTPVPQEHLKQIIDAARMAPTAGNQQPWKFIVVQKPETIQAIKQATVDLRMASTRKDHPTSEQEAEAVRQKQTARLEESYLSAPAYILVLTDNQSAHPSYNGHDGPLAAGYVCLAAKAFGYGTVYITDAIPEQATKIALKIPDRYRRVAFIPVGIPREWPKTPDKKSYDGMVVYETFE